MKENEDIGGKVVTGNMVRSNIMGMSHLPNSDTAVSVEFLDQHVLVIENDRACYDLVKDYVKGASSLHATFQLPDDVTCKHCVLHWKYLAEIIRDVTKQNAASDVVMRMKTSGAAQKFVSMTTQPELTSRQKRQPLNQLLLKPLRLDSPPATKTAAPNSTETRETTIPKNKTQQLD
ncbi:hypothetical protein MAR_005667 [Mya arenaria]|uniref:Uncharacterized protein n=1 Tax=Mya arenaria TaxID=6604 RepID=A0ABY7F050_MYAAR|nr:hypothetical protein MAR_005667 [Mya arenaria]